MKKIIISLILAVSFVTSVFAAGVSPQLKYAIKLYKSKNYLGSMQALEAITANDPGNALAHYYLGMCYVQVSDTTKAAAEYDMVITLSPTSELASNANTGKTNLSGKPQQAAPLDKFINPLVQKKEFLSDEAKSKIQEKNIKTIIENVNNKRENDPAIYNRIDNLEPKKSSNDKPTQEQITEAMEVLKKAGIDPVNSTSSNIANMQASQINPEMMQMNMLMSAFGGGGNNMNGGGNSMNNMLPMLMMMQNNGQGNNKVDPETIQVMMSQMMMPGMMGLYENNNNNNNY